MNILVLTSAYPQIDDGEEIVTPTVKYFCDKWQEAGHNVIVIHNNSSFPALFYKVPNSIRHALSSKMGHNFPTEASRKPLAIVQNGVRVFRLPMTKIVPHTKFSQRKIERQVFKIVSILKSENFIPDVIISHWVNPQLDLILKLKNIYPVKVSLVFHGDCSSKKIEQYNLKDSIKKIDAVGCRNESYAHYVKEVLGLKKMPFICYSGIPDEKADSQLSNIDQIELSEKPEYIYVGRLVKYKNIDVIINALNEIYPSKDFKLHIVGVGAERDNLENLVNELGLRENVVFHGQVSRDNVFDLMKKSYCFVMVSENETFGMVYIEAMLAGCITIASKGGGVDGVIVDGENGFLSEQGDVNSLIRKLQEINNMSEEKRNNLRKRGIRTAYEYKDSNVAQRYLNDVLTFDND